MNRAKLSVSSTFRPSTFRLSDHLRFSEFQLLPSAPVMNSTPNHDSESAREARTLANRLGTTPHLSPLLMKARRMGLENAEDLERLAVLRGLRYYDSHGNSMAAPPDPAESRKFAASKAFSNEELALALLSPAAPYSMQRLRMSAAMIAAEGNQPEKIVRLARYERSEPIIRHIAQCGLMTEPDNSFWSKLLQMLPGTDVPPLDVLPHLTRFVAMTGITRTGTRPVMKWIRPTGNHES